MFNVDDDSYSPPTKEFIRNSLTYGLLPEEHVHVDESTNPVYLTQNRGKLMSSLIDFAMKNREKIVRVPILGRFALSIKRNMLDNNLSAQSADASELDFRNILGLGIDDFIRQLYGLALDRLPDTHAIEHWKFALSNGTKKEAIIYMVCTSPEFANRRRVVHLGEYRKAFQMHQTRERIKRAPVLGWLWSFMAIPRRLTAVLLQLNAMQAQIDSFNSEHLQSSTQMKLLSSQQNALQTQFDVLNQNSIKQQNALQTQLDQIDQSILQVQAQLDQANQNTIKAHVKLDQNEIAILNTFNQNKPFIYSFPGGVTAVQTKEYIIGVPSEQWRLAVFLNWHGSFEIGTEKYFRSLLKRGMNVLDIGAYIGIYTLHALAASCTVYSYEPTPRIFDILLGNIEINGFEPTKRANAFNLAVSNTEGKVQFSLEGSGHGQNNSLYAIDVDAEKIEVNTISLDKHLNHVDHIDVVKIDVEGAEPLVLMGMREIIAKNPDIRIIMEFAPSHLKRAGNDPLGFIQQIRSMGLDIHLIDASSGEILEISDDDLCGVFSVNVLLENQRRK